MEIKTHDIIKEERLYAFKSKKVTAYSLVGSRF